jgi:predicted secreted protein
MANVNGFSGSVTYASGYVTGVKSWSINLTAAELDVTDMASTSGFGEYIGGRKEWTGTYTCVWDSAVDIDTQFGGNPSSATFTYDTGATISGSILITGIDTTVNIDAANEVTFTFRGSGVATVAVA